jgi:hypothetical protein
VTRQSYDEKAIEGELQSHLQRVAESNYEQIRWVEEVLGPPTEPLTTVARCLDIHQGGGREVVVGTPLYVAFHVPD